MLKKTSGHGNKNGKIDFCGRNSGYALLFAIAVLVFLSLLPCAFCALGKMRIQNIEKKYSEFYQKLEKENNDVLEEWKNLCGGGKNETD